MNEPKAMVALLFVISPRRPAAPLACRNICPLKTKPAQIPLTKLLPAARGEPPFWTWFIENPRPQPGG